ncbi:MAG: AAA family ATPase [Proteobacteria bacterium]|nr:hypothetical protein [Pseudomonadota bacterium]NOG59907.1 AAA family ATPase [Pseudomonadota bacterium]
MPIYPSKISNDSPYSERYVFESFSQLQLPWYIFHSVAWQTIRNGRQGDGEADFIIVHPAHGIIVLEVKGGDEITIEYGAWFSHNEHGKHSIKNPFEQAKDSKFALIKFLKEKIDIKDKFYVSHAVVFPKMTIDDNISTYGDRKIILDRNDLKDPEESLKRIFKHWNQYNNITNDHLDCIIDTLAPTITIKKRLIDNISEAEDKIIELTKSQIKAFRQLRRIRKCIVLGSAGTGKSVLAKYKAVELSKEHNVLLVCYNKLLAEHTAKELGNNSNITICTYHHLIFSEANKAKLPIPDSISSSWWENDSASLLLEASDINNTYFDSIIIDEGQDFSYGWIESLELLFSDKENCFFYVFMDSHQDIYSRNINITSFKDWPNVTLDTNCRNTDQIADKVNSIFKDNSFSLGIVGPDPVFIRGYGNKMDCELIENLCEELLMEEGIDSKKITILSDNNENINYLTGKAICNTMFTNFGKKGITVESISRFKGLESEIIILNITKIEAQLIEFQQKCYVGLSRARNALFLVTTEKIASTINFEQK